MFISLTEAQQYIRADQLTVLVQADPAKFDTAVATAQAEMEGYLEPLFDTAAIFAATGAARHPLVMMFITDITLYHLHSHLTPGQIPDLRMKRYDDAIEWLKSVQSGLTQPSLPKHLDANNLPNSDIRWGGNNKTINNY